MIITKPVLDEFKNNAYVSKIIYDYDENITSHFIDLDSFRFHKNNQMITISFDQTNFSQKIKSFEEHVLFYTIENSREWFGIKMVNDVSNNMEYSDFDNANKQNPIFDMFESLYDKNKTKRVTMNINKNVKCFGLNDEIIPIENISSLCKLQLSIEPINIIFKRESFKINYEITKIKIINIMQHQKICLFE
jgi:hypothetical protein